MLVAEKEARRRCLRGHFLTAPIQLMALQSRTTRPLGLNEVMKELGRNVWLVILVRKRGHLAEPAFLLV